MRPLLLACALLAAPFPAVLAASPPAAIQETEREEPDPERVAALVTKLERARARGPVEEQVALLEEARSVPAREVVEAVAKELSAKDELVVAAALDSLRYLAHPDALKALHGAAKRDRRIADSETLHPKLVRAIGGHQSPTSIELLASGMFSEARESTVARIFALANIRSKASAEALFGALGQASVKRVQPYMVELRIALMRLTGVDQGISQDAWRAWWNANKKALEVTPEAPLLPKEMQMRWDKFWGAPRATERATEREERGKQESRR